MNSRYSASITALVSLLMLGVSALASATPLYKSPSLRFDTGIYPYALAAGDLNGDGKPDLVSAASGVVSVHLGRGDGTFLDRVDYSDGSSFDPNAAADALALGDLNGDGKLDLVSADPGQSSISVWLGNGDGTLAARSIVTTGTGSHSVALGDLNGDGKLDAVTANTDGTISILLGHGDGTFAAKVDLSVGATATCIALGDFDGDGKLDLAIGESSSAIQFRHGNGDGTFGPAMDLPTTYTPVNVKASDLNGDGRLDLIAVNHGGNVSVLLGHGDGSFAPDVEYFAGTPWPQSAAVGDFDGDGKQDLVVGLIADLYDNSPFEIRLLFGNGDGTFQPSMGLASGPDPGAVLVADFNGDGKADIAATSHTYTQAVSGYLPNHTLAVFMGNGDGTFGNWVHYPLAAQLGSAVAIADMNRDGWPDVVCLDGAVSVLLGTGGGSLAPRTDYPATIEPNTLVVQDLNGDGYPDVAGIIRGQSKVVVLLGTGGGALGPARTFACGNNPTALAAGDVNGDGIPDLNTSDLSNGAVSVLLGKGDGTFPTHTEIAGIPLAQTIAVGDVNGDGIADIVEGGDAQLAGVGVMLGHGGGTFDPPITLSNSLSPRSLKLADMDGDGLLDVVALGGGCPLCTGAYHPPGLAFFMKGHGDGTLAAPTIWTAEMGVSSLAVGDVDGDGKPDLVTMAGMEGAVAILSGRGDGTFGVPYGFGAPGGALALGDLNRDGRVDVVVSGPPELTVLLNTLTPLYDAIQVGDIQASAGEGQVGLRWSAFVDASAIFRVLRSGSATGVYQAVGKDLHSAGEKADYTFTDNTAQPGAVYFYKIGYSEGGAWNYAGPVRVEVPAAVLALRPAQPNPARGVTRLDYELARAGAVDLSIFNLSGQRVRTLLSGQAPAGKGSATWDGRGEGGRQLAGGIYFARLQAGAGVKTQRIVILR